MLFDLPENLPVHRSKSKRKTHAKDSGRSSPKKKPKSPKKVPKTSRKMLIEHAKEDFQMFTETRTDQEIKALENLRSLNDEFDTGSDEPEDEIQKWTTNLQINLVQTTHRERIKTTTSTSKLLEKARNRAESELNKPKPAIIRLPIITLLKKTLKSEDYSLYQDIRQHSNRLVCHTEPDKTMNSQERSYLKTYQDFSHLLKKAPIENNNDLIMTERPRPPLEGEKRYRSQIKSISIRTKHEEEYEIQSTSVNPGQGTTNKSTITKQNLITEEIQQARIHSPRTFVKHAIKGITKREKFPQESVTIKKENPPINECVQSLQQELIGHFSYQSKPSIKGYLNLSKEELQDEEERIAQNIGVKLTQLRRDNLVVKSGRINTEPQEDAQVIRRPKGSILPRPKLQPRSIDKLADKDNSASKDTKELKGLKETQEQKEIQDHRDGSQTRFKTPMLSDFRENILMQGFNIFKFGNQNQGFKEKEIKEMDLSPPVATPMTARSPDAEFKNTRTMLHSRSSSSRFKTKIISKGSPLLFIMGSEKEAKFRHFKKQSDSKNNEGYNSKNIFAPPYLDDESDLKDQTTQKRKNNIFDLNNPTPSFEGRNFNHIKTFTPFEHTTTEKEGRNLSYLVETKKEKSQNSPLRRA